MLIFIYLLLFMVLEWPEMFVFRITDSEVFVFPVNNFVHCGCFGVFISILCITVLHSHELKTKISVKTYHIYLMISV